MNSHVSSALIPSASQHVDSLLTNIHGQWLHPLRLANNFSALKTVAGIIQVIVRSAGLYHASERHFAMFGYVEYSLTFIQYMLMSLINLLAPLCEPQYPSMYLPRHGTATGRGPRDGAALDDRLMWHPPGAIVELVE